MHVQINNFYETVRTSAVHQQSSEHMLRKKVLKFCTPSMLTKSSKSKHTETPERRQLLQGLRLSNCSRLRSIFILRDLNIRRYLLRRVECIFQTYKQRSGDAIYLKNILKICPENFGKFTAEHS